MAVVRIATFNLENLDETEPGDRPSLAERITLMKPQIVRLRADIGCFQEVNGQERPGMPRALLALGELLTGTNLDGAQVVTTKPADNAVYKRTQPGRGYPPARRRAPAAAQRPGRPAYVQAAHRDPGGRRPGRDRDRAADPARGD
jgi:hypothetical protein